MVRAIEQLAPVAIAIGKFEYRIGVQFDRDVALGQRLAQQIGTTDIAPMRKMRRYFRARRQRQCGGPLPPIGALHHAGGPVQLSPPPPPPPSPLPHTHSPPPPRP